MTLVFKRETYNDLVEDIKPLLIKHHKELALYQDSIPLNPNWDFYQKIDELGMIIAISARTVEGILKGYAVYISKEHPHYQRHCWGLSDLFWLDPDERNLGNGRNLFLTVEDELKKIGVSVMHTTLKVAHPVARYLLESMGHVLVEYGMSKKL